MTYEEALKSDGKYAYCICGHEKIVGKIMVKDISKVVYFLNNYFGELDTSKEYIRFYQLFNYNGELTKNSPEIILANRTKDNYDLLVVGDVLKDNNLYLTVIATHGNLFWYSSTTNSCSSAYSFQEANDNGWELILEEDKVDCIELTIEEIAKVMKVDPKSIRIKD